MKAQKAKEELSRCLKENKTITIRKLKKLLTDLNMSLESSESKEVRYLKREIRNLIKVNKKLRKRIKEMKGND
ncbi:hypothetical protein GCM10011409_46080 [Lentibacillus populi]|uniref:Uncharacterized protein n=1 Tax=Lentibacillus populi TaxID=1827502 RepID=A0A9W5U2P4_9BACI|nr:hypothetical protein GCM10011409_46080 [Lentibacillus populi]